MEADVPASPGTGDVIALPLPAAMRKERFIPLASGRAVAVNCRNKPRFRKRLTVCEGGLIMQIA
jgi:hypothetical protein